MAIFQNKMELVEELNRYNRSALAALSSIEISAIVKKTHLEQFDSEADAMMASYKESVDHIRNMAKTCAKLSKALSLDEFLVQMEGIEARSVVSISEGGLALELGYDNEDIMNSLKDDFYKKIQRLSLAMRDPEKEDFKLTNAYTLHDLIRFLHQIGVNSAYDDINDVDSASSSSFKHASFDGASMYIIDCDGKLPSKGRMLEVSKIEHPLIKPIIDLYESSLKKNGNETFKGILKNNRLMTQIHLGCHYAELEASVGKEYLVRFFFRDTPFKDYANAKYRTAYVNNVLKALGFEVKVKGNETTAEFTGSDNDEIGQKMREVVRLAVSTKNLDLGGSGIDRYQNKSVNAFFKGITHMKSYLDECKTDGKKDDKSITVKQR